MSMIPQKIYTRFNYKEFGNSSGKSFIVPTATNIAHNEATLEKDRIINEAIAEHFAENEQDASDVAEISETPNPAIDIEAVKTESYSRGYENAKISLEPELKRVKEDDFFHSLLKEKLESITPGIDPQDQTFKLASDLLGVIAKKLHLMVPADFESVILGEMVPLLSKYYKIGAITLNVNPERVDYCKNLFRIGSLPHNIAENIVVTSDESIARDSCNMEWNNTLLEYNQEELTLDVEKILEHLKMEINNR